MAWASMALDPINTDAIKTVVEAVSQPLNVALGVADLAIDALEMAQVLLLGAENLTAATLNEAINAIEASIKEALECNVSTFLHMNVNWDRTWDLTQFRADGRWPWAGSGLRGWMLDVMSSLQDTSDPMRPLTDVDTNVWGLLFVFGVPGYESVGQMAKAAGAFGDFSDFLRIFDAEAVEKYGNDYRHLARLGSSFVDPFVRGAAGRSDVLDRMKERWAAAGNNVTEVEGYVPAPGNYPHWYSVPMQTLVPPLESIFGGLQNVLSGLRPPVGQLDILGDLLAAIRARITYIRYIIARIEAAILALADLINFITQCHVYVIDTSYGEGSGLDGALAAAAADPAAPDYGDDGIVFGIGMFATAGNMAAPLEAFWSLLGVDASTYASEATARVANIRDSYDALFVP